MFNHISSSQNRPPKVETGRQGKGATSHHISWSQHIGRYFAAHFSACKISFRNIIHTPIASLMTIIAIGVCLSFPICLYLFISNIQHLSKGWDQHCAISLYIEPTSTTQQVDAILAKIKHYPFVINTKYLDPQAALKEFQDASGFKDTLALLPENPLPAVISVQLDTQKTEESELKLMKETLAKMPQVKQVDFDLDWVEKLNIFLSLGNTLAYFLYLIIGAGVMLVVGNTIRLALESHREEIEVLKLVGATTAFIRRPFLYRGILFGILGGIFATLVVNIAIYSLKPSVLQLSSLFSGVFSLENLRFCDTVTLLGISALLGLLGSVIAFIQQNYALASESQ